VPAEPLIDWPHSIFEFLEFIAAFLAAGALGFRFALIGRLRRHGMTHADDDRVHAAALRRAAWIGLAGALYAFHDSAGGLPGAAARLDTTVSALLASFTSPGVRFWTTLLATIGFAVVAVARRGWGWPLAAIGILVGTLRGALFGQWGSVVKPLHMLAGGLWIGTLFILVVAGIGIALDARTPPERRGPLVAAMVHAFSPFALIVAGILGFCGVILARRELQPFSTLWTTPWGYALLTKLAVVAVVVGLGAWNWRRQKPRLGSESSARSLRRSAGLELAVACLVLVITAILASLPSPK
jgi:putative copper export protein